MTMHIRWPTSAAHAKEDSAPQKSMYGRSVIITPHTGMATIYWTLKVHQECNAQTHCPQPYSGNRELIRHHTVVDVPGRSRDTEGTKNMASYETEVQKACLYDILSGLPYRTRLCSQSRERTMRVPDTDVREKRWP